MRLQAFTLIELLVVIVIIGILSTVTVSTFSGSRHEARDIKNIAQMTTAYRFIEADMASKATNKYHEVYRDGGADGTERIVQGMYDLGATLPDPSESCYMVLILSRYQDQEVSNTDVSGIAIVTPKSGVDTNDIPVTDRNFDDYYLAVGSQRVLDILKTEAGYRPTATYTWGWAYRMGLNQRSYENRNCQRQSAHLWNGAAVDGSPHYHIFSLSPLDPSYAP